MREICKELWRDQFQDDRKVELLVAKMNETWGALPPSLTSMVKPCEPCTPNCEILEEAEHIKKIMLPETANQFEEEVEIMKAAHESAGFLIKRSTGGIFDICDANRFV